MADARTLAVLALVAAVPLVVVFVVAMVRGYEITIHFRRPNRDDRDGR
jgi:hypothetical protein